MCVPDLAANNMGTCRVARLEVQLRQESDWARPPRCVPQVSPPRQGWHACADGGVL